MAQVDSSSPLASEGSRIAITSFDRPIVGHEPQERVPEESKDQETECSDSTTPKPSPEEADDDVMFIFSAPRSKKQQRRILDPANSPPVFNPQCERLSCQSTTSPDFPARRGTTGMVQGLEGCHIEDDDTKPSQIRGTSLPARQPITLLQQIQDLNLPPVDPTTEPNFAAMQDMPLSDSCLRWWNEPESSFQPQQANHSGWMDFQHNGEHPSHNTMEEHQRQNIIDSVDEQISPRTKPATIFHPSNNSPKENSTNDRDMATKINDPTRYQPPSYFSTPMPAWSKNWTAFPSESASPFSRARIPSSTPLSVVRNIFGLNVQQGQHPHTHLYGQPVYYPPPYGEIPRGYIHGKPNHMFHQQHHEHGRFVSKGGTGEYRGIEIPVSRSPVIFSPSPQHPHITPPSQSTGFQNPSHFQKRDNPSHGHPQPPTRIDNPNDVLRKPSLYKIPPWSSSTTQDVLAPSDIHSSGFHQLQNAQGTKVSNLSPGQTQIDHHSHNPHPNPQAQSPPPHLSPDPEPTTPRRRGARKFTPNLIVDIAETCQQHFPFAMIAERHSVPLQKVFDTFSAIIQLPLLRNADDKRRHGSLGKRRMREYREAKKKMAEEMRGVKRPAGDEQGGEAKRVKVHVSGNGNGNGQGQPLLRTAVLNHSRGREC